MTEIMKSVYSNTTNPTRVKWLAGIFIFLCLALAVLYWFIDFDGLNLFTLGIQSAFWIYFFLYNSLNKIVVDEDEMILYDSNTKKYPIKIQAISYITFKESRKGKYRSLFVHDNDVHYLDLRTSKKNALAIADQLLKLNPAIEVRHQNYL